MVVVVVYGLVAAVSITQVFHCQNENFRANVINVQKKSTSEKWNYDINGRDINGND